MSESNNTKSESIGMWLLKRDLKNTQEQMKVFSGDRVKHAYLSGKEDGLKSAIHRLGDV